VATLQVRHLDHPCGLRGVRVKGGKRRDIPLPSAVTEYLLEYVQRVLSTELGQVGPETPLFWSTWGRRIVGTTRAPMTGKNIWRLCKVYGRLIGCPTLKPHDLRHGVAMEVLEHHHDLEEVRALLGHARIDTTQVYASSRPPQLKRAVAFLRAEGRGAIGRVRMGTVPRSRNIQVFLKPGPQNANEIHLVAPTGFDGVRGKYARSESFLLPRYVGA